MHREIAACLVFVLFLLLYSYFFNRRLTRGKLEVDFYQIALSASAVLVMALVAESVVNPLYEFWFGVKLWEYRVFPLHDSNVSALAVFMWTAYGVHLYLTLQTLERRLPARLNNDYGKSFLMSLEAPLFAEVSGNLVFLLFANTYYAYYLPSDVGHFTSLQVIPAYMVGIFIGLAVLRGLRRLPRHVAVPSALFAVGSGYLIMG